MEDIRGKVQQVAANVMSVIGIARSLTSAIQTYQWPPPVSSSSEVSLALPFDDGCFNPFFGVFLLRAGRAFAAEDGTSG